MVLDAEPLRYPGAAAHDERAMGLPGAHHGIAGARLSRSIFRSRSSAIDGTGSTGRWASISNSPLADRRYLAPPAARLHRPAGAGRFRRHGPARGGSVGRGRRGDHPGRLVARFRRRHDVQGVARTRASGARDGRFRPGAEISAEFAAGPAGKAPQLDHDRAPAPRHLAGKLSEVGPGPRQRDQHNAGDLVHLRVELQGLWRLPRSNAMLFGIRCYLISVRELVDGSQVGAARAPGAQRPAPRARRLQGPHPLSRRRGRMAGAFR